NKKRKKYKDLYWTNSAIDCYNSKMECSKCFNRDICESVVALGEEPPMKKIVRNLLDKLGEPPKNINIKFII
ncbi:MAG: hypothetical protein MJ180_01040, partial [Candidatus Gastranaerophilales bacterium]|nr:hypothetical protein [Candidatus Gastranaerophilales bacterium]